MNLRSLYARWRRGWLYARCLASDVRAIVLRYHSVADPGAASRYIDPGLSVTPERFREQIALLQRHFELLAPGQLLARLAAGSPQRRGVMITFDDGYRDNVEVALPILREFDAVAVFYVTSGPLQCSTWLWVSELRRLTEMLPEGPLDLPAPGPVSVRRGSRRELRRALTGWLAGLDHSERERALDRLAARAGLERGAGLDGSFMSPDDLRTLRRSGMIVGAHTRSHPHLDRVDAATGAAEVEGGRQDLERLLGEPVVHFAYPNPGGLGKFGPVARSAVSTAGFLSGVTSRPAPLAHGCDPLLLPRIGVYSGSQEKQLFELLERYGER
ncbi:MAG: polysaccharide deacetylase family protein [Acidobacteriota bacterium]|nr:MAG: polysaccharide deacetylase family protein [Acidobacteriota bacterium]